MRRRWAWWLALCAMGCDATPTTGATGSAPMEAATAEATPEAVDADSERLAGSSSEGPARKSPGGTRLSLGQDVTGEMIEKQERLGSFATSKAPPWRMRDGRRPRVVRRDGRGYVLRLPDPRPVGTPTVHDGRLVVGAGLWIGALDARRGDVVWARSTVDMSPSTAVCEGEICAWNTFSCTLTAVNASTGELVSNTLLGPKVLSAPAMADGVAYAAFEYTNGSPGLRFSGGVTAIEVGTGTMRWARRMERDALGAPVVDGADVHVATWGGTLHRFDRRTGAVHASHMRYLTGPPIVRAEGLVYSRNVRTDGQWTAQVVHEALSTPSEGAPVMAAAALLSWPAPRARTAIGHIFPDAHPGEQWPPDLVTDWPGTQLLGYLAAKPYGDHEIFAGYSVVAAGHLDVMVLGDDIVAFDGRDVAWSHSLAAVYDHPRVTPYFDRRQIWHRHLGPRAAGVWTRSCKNCSPSTAQPSTSSDTQWNRRGCAQLADVVLQIVAVARS